MDKLQQIFDYQKKLTYQFFEVAYANARLPYRIMPFDLDQGLAQDQLRMIHSDLIEEMGEVLALESHLVVNQREEIADVAHFLIELMLCSGVMPRHLVPTISGDTLDYIYRVVEARPYLSRSDSALRFIGALGWSMHCLKNKPWKANPKLSDVLVFKSRLIHTFYAFIHMTIAYEMSSETLYQFYMGKAAINQKRIEGGA